MISCLELLTVRSNRKTLCLEVNPPRSASCDSIFAKLEGNLDGVDILNVTDCALARLKMAAIPFAATLKNRFQREVVVNVSCRDRNLMALQADLLAGWALGVRSIVALTGDAMTIGDSPERKGVFEVNSVGLLNAIRTLNSGKDLNGGKLGGATDYISGVVVNPNAKNVSAEVRRLVKKREGGAQYALSQPVFDIETAQSFFDAVATVDLPIFLGLMVIKSKSAGLALNSIPGIKLPQALLESFDNTDDDYVQKRSLENAIRIAEMFKGQVQGFHVISGASISLAFDLVQELRRVS
mgnify:CR=1 FL=1